MVLVIRRAPPGAIETIGQQWSGFPDGAGQARACKSVGLIRTNGIKAPSGGRTPRQPRAYAFTQLVLSATFPINGYTTSDIYLDMSQYTVAGTHLRFMGLGPSTRPARLRLQRRHQPGRCRRSSSVSASNNSDWAPRTVSLRPLAISQSAYTFKYMFKKRRRLSSGR